MRKLKQLIFLCLLFPVALGAQEYDEAFLLGTAELTAKGTNNKKVDRSAFLQKYGEYAILEMERTGIPASITLAQAILESSWGLSELSTSGNNFFGIKCKKSWTGGTFYLEDDDFDAEGNLTKSCFRTYNNAYESFVDHSDFLLKNKRYAILFTYAAEDYTSWAKGLKTCGYATNPEYANILIKLIKKYELTKFDRVEPVAPEVPDELMAFLESNDSESKLEEGTSATLGKQTESSVQQNASNTTTTTTDVPPKAYRLPDNYFEYKKQQMAKQQQESTTSKKAAPAPVELSEKGSAVRVLPSIKSNSGIRRTTD